MLSRQSFSDELLCNACAALYYNVTEENRQRIRNRLDPVFPSGYAGDPTIEAAFTAFLRHPFSTMSDARRARSIGRKTFFDVAIQNMQVFLCHKIQIRRKLGWCASLKFLGDDHVS